MSSGNVMSRESTISHGGRRDRVRDSIGGATPAARQASERTQTHSVTDFSLCLEFASATTRSGSPSGSVSAMARNQAAMTACRVATDCRSTSAITA